MAGRDRNPQAANQRLKGLILQSVLYNETADLFTNTGSYQDMLSQSITLGTRSTLMIDWRAVYYSIGGASSAIVFKLVVDGSDIKEFHGTYSDAGPTSGIATIHHFVTGLSPGARTVKIQWKYLAGTGTYCSCSTSPELYYSRMILQEISG